MMKSWRIAKVEKDKKMRKGEVKKKKKARKDEVQDDERKRRMASKRARKRSRSKDCGEGKN